MATYQITYLLNLNFLKLKIVDIFFLVFLRHQKRISTENMNINFKK